MRSRMQPLYRFPVIGKAAFKNFLRSGFRESLMLLKCGLKLFNIHLQSLLCREFLGYLERETISIV